MIPIAGSAYTYSYATMGELVAWIIGWDLVLEYAVGAATVAIAWSEYFNRVLEFVRHAASRTNGAIRRSSHAPDGRQRHHEHPGGLHPRCCCRLLLIRGTQESAFVNSLIVVIKVAIVLMVIAIGWGFINPANHTPFIPEATTYVTPQGVTHTYGGIMGILGAAGVVFFAFIGFDAVSTAAQEAKNPEARHADRHPRIAGRLHDPLRAVLLRAERRRDGRGLPHRTGREASVAFAITTYMTGYEWLSQLVTVAILAGFSSVILVMLLGQSRVFYSMSHDGLVPKVFSDVHPRFKTPYKSNMLFFVLHGALRGVRARRHRRRDDQHRDAVRVHAGVRRRLDHARPPAGHAARLHGAGAAGRGDPRHRGLRRDDLRARLDELAAARRLAGDRPGALLRLRAAATAALENAASSSTGNAHDAHGVLDRRRRSPPAMRAGDQAGGRGVHDTQHGRPPGLGIVLVGDDPASRGLRAQQGQGRHRAPASASTCSGLPATASLDDALALVERLNASDRSRRHPGAVAAAEGDGARTRQQRVFDTIDPAQGRRRLQRRRASACWCRTVRSSWPCTPSGVIELLEREKHSDRRHARRRDRPQRHRRQADGDAAAAARRDGDDLPLEDARTSPRCAARRTSSSRPSAGPGS